MKYLPPLKSLHFFLVAGQCQSFKQAAQQLNVTQAAVSQQIRSLEDNLQVSLFERSSKNTQLTAKGRELLPFMQRAFSELTQGVQHIASDGQPNVLRISTIHSFASLWLMPRIQQFQQRHPKLMLQLVPSSELIDFNQANIDLAIRLGKGGAKDLVEKKIYSDTLVFVASPSITENIDITNPKHVFSLPLISDTSNDIEVAFNNYCHQNNINRADITPVLATDNALPLIDNVVQGRGFMLVNRSLVNEHLQSGRLITLLNYSIPSPYSLFLVAPKQQFDWPKVQAFEQWLIPELTRSMMESS